jgi:ElaB/YqjD/DUF883 family membrane-anchored ribosome-binding protein
MSRDTEYLREEIEQTRDRMSDTLDQLGERLNPNRIKAQVSENIREATIGRVENMARHAADRVNEKKDGLLDTIRDNPIPAALIGIGLGWMLFNGRRDDRYVRDSGLNGFAGTGYLGDISANSPRLRQDEAAGGIGASISYDRETGVRDRVASATHKVEEKLSDVSHRAGERVTEVAERAQEKVSDVAHRVQYAASDFAGTTRQQAYRVEDRFQRTLQDSPLAVGAVALAVGLAAGFAIPETRRESELMGDARDKLLDRAKEKAVETRDRVQEVAERIIDETVSPSDAPSGYTDSTNGTAIL